MKCANCKQEVLFELMPDGYATKRWPEAVKLGTRKGEPYVRCPKCTATFPKWGIEQYNE